LLIAQIRCICVWTVVSFDSFINNKKLILILYVKADTIM